MKQALGLVEISGLSTAVVVADTMVKAANIRILEIENTKGLGYMTIKVEGDVGAVKAAVDTGCQIGRMNGKLVSWKVIARPSDYVENTFCKKEAAKPLVPPQPPRPEPPIEEGNKIVDEAPDMVNPEPMAEEPEKPVLELEADKSVASELSEKAAAQDGEKPEKTEDEPEGISEEITEEITDLEVTDPSTPPESTVSEIKKTTRRTGIDKRKK